jgi:hypothetical protein
MTRDWSAFGLHRLALGSLAWQAVLWIAVSRQLERAQITPRVELSRWILIGALATAWLAGLARRRARLSDGAMAIAVLALFSIPGLFGQYAALSLHQPWADWRLAGLDRLLGIDVPTVVTWTSAHPTVYALLLAGYATFVPQVVVLPFVMAAVLDRKRLWTYVLVYQMAWSIALVGLLFWPSEYAFTHYGYPLDLHFVGADLMADLHRARSGLPWILPISASNGLITFPSFHAVIGCLMIWTFRGWNGWNALVLVVNGTLILGTFCLGAHYGIDILASLVLTPLIIIGAERLTADGLQPAPKRAMAVRAVGTAVAQRTA